MSQCEREFLLTLDSPCLERLYASGRGMTRPFRRAEETRSFYRLPRQHPQHRKSTHMLERLNEEIKRRTHVVRIFPWDTTPITQETLD